MNPNDNYDDKADMTFMERHKVVLSVVAVAIVGTGVYFLQSKFSKRNSSQSKASEYVSVHLPPPPSTPPPPVPTPPPQEEVKQEDKMVMQEKVDDNEQKPDDKPPDAAPLTTSITGNGPDAFGLKAGNGGGNYFGAGGGSHSKYGWYAAQVQTVIGDALKKNPKTRAAAFNAQVRIWLDITGRVTRVKLSNTNDDPKVDEAINEVLTGLQQKEAAPAGMPMPIVMRVNGQRPDQK